MEQLVKPSVALRARYLDLKDYAVYGLLYDEIEFNICMHQNRA